MMALLNLLQTTRLLNQLLDRGASVLGAVWMPRMCEEAIIALDIGRENFL